MRYLPCCEMYHPSGDLSFVPEGLYLPIFLSWSGQARCLYPIIFYFTFTVGRFLLAYFLIYLIPGICDFLANMFMGPREKQRPPYGMAFSA